MGGCLFLLLVCCCWVAVVSQQPFLQVNTIAGVPLNYGDGNPATKSSLNGPSGITMHPITKEVYIADTLNHQIRKISSSGIISTVAGKSRVNGYNGDGQLAIDAYLERPKGVTVALNNEVIFTDTRNHIIRKVFLNGTIATIVGTPKVSGFSVDGTIATQARLSFPTAIAYDSVNDVLYFSDQYYMVRKLVNNTIYTVAGSSTSGSTDNASGVNARFNEINGFHLSISNQTLLVADSFNHAIRMINLADPNYFVSTVVGRTGFEGIIGDGGLATNAALRYPLGVSATSQYIYVLDSNSYRIRRVDRNSSIITTVVGTRTAASVPHADNVTATTTQLGRLYGIVCEESYCLFTSEFMQIVSRYDPSVNRLFIAAGNGQREQIFAQLNTPSSVPTEVKLEPLRCVPYGNEYLVAEATVVRRITGSRMTTIAGKTGGATQLQNNMPALETSFVVISSILVNGSTLFIADRGTHTVRSMSLLETNGNMTVIAGIPGRSGASDDNNLATNSTLLAPADLAILGHDLYILERSSQRVRKVDMTTGIITTVAGKKLQIGSSGDGGLATDALLNNPLRIAVSPDREIYILDYNNYKIRKVSANGTISTFAGNGTIGYAGDGGLATQAMINLANAIAYYNGELFIGDRYYVRKVNAAGTISTIMGDPNFFGVSADSRNTSSVVFSRVFDLYPMGTNDWIVLDDVNYVVQRIGPARESIVTLSTMDR